MKRTFLVVGIVAVCLCLAAATAQAQSVVGSRHDMSGRITEPGASAPVCVYCHTPHGGDSSKGPLWNRLSTTATYTPYSSSTIDMTPLATSAGVGSDLCMSCHDGSVAINVLVNAPTTQTGVYGSAKSLQNWNATTGFAFGTVTDALDSAELGFFGTILSNQHPIGLTYDPTKDTDFNTLASAKTAGLVFYDTGANKVECQTCHDVHEYTNVPFLRVANTSSALCTTCHKK